MAVYTLTDIERDDNSDGFELDSSGLGHQESWAVRLRRLGGGLRAGVEVLEVKSRDLSLSILPTRGMGLWRGDYRGIALGWQAPVLGPVHPQFVNLADRGGTGWLQGFDEWLCR